MRDEKAGARAPGHRVTLKEIAAELGVSPMTVSNAYNHPERLSPVLRERVFQVAQRYRYAGPDPTARSLRRGHTGALGVIYDTQLSYTFDDAAATAFMRGLARAAETERLGLLLIPGSPGEERDATTIGTAMVDGFVVYSVAEHDPVVQAALARRVPLVVVDQPAENGVPLVGIDDRSAAREAARHLLRLGHRRFGAVSFGLARDDRQAVADLDRQRSTRYQVTRARLEGFATALSEAGIPWADVPILECPGSAPELSRRAGHWLLTQPNRPTAILAMSDRLALGVIDAARERGFSVPADLSVVGFDDIPEAATSEPPLTTIHQDHAEKGCVAGRLVIARLRGESIGSPGVLPSPLIVRASTAPPPET